VGDRTAHELHGNPDLPVLVKADNAVPYGEVVRAMVILQKAGAKKVGFITDPLPQPRHRGN
jgi:biopolymer transport protein TolR